MKLKSKEEIKEIDLNINWFKFIYGQSEAASKGCAPECHSDLNIGRFLERKGKAAGGRKGWSRLLPRLRRQKKLAGGLCPARGQPDAQIPSLQRRYIYILSAAEFIGIQLINNRYYKSYRPLSEQQ
ncbi:hypothetical protein LOAG_11269 [Loa loa]|uniref:Uncharacterized protein n=1 Tax=Loa loa TaxID=7209 RepID=A0A1I7VX28_LOALO|nr:hypothetical protein LOAG_11269 [Loa loa]EFO17231.1 hypothetical protein LOAG_11269 [Loa loa]